MDKFITFPFLCRFLAFVIAGSCLIWTRAEVHFMTDVQLNKFDENSTAWSWQYLILGCRMECFDLGDGSCNACLYDEKTGRCELYSLSGYFNKMLRIGETDVSMTSYKHWTFKYAEEDPGWNIVLKRVFADINFSNATWEEMVEGISGMKDFWVGLTRLNSLTTNGKNTLKLKFSKNNVVKEVVYKDFHVDTEENGFQYTVGAYSGTYHDCMGGGSGSQQSSAFLTPDIAPVGTSEADLKKLPNWFNTSPGQCCQFNWFGVMDTGNDDDVTCDGSSSGGMTGCLAVCPDSDAALLDYIIVQVQ